MALDEPKDTDDVFDIDGFKYLVDKDFMEQVKPIKVDFSGLGFKLDCGYDFGAAAGGCSGCASDGTCG